MRFLLSDHYVWRLCEEPWVDHALYPYPLLAYHSEEVLNVLEIQHQDGRKELAQKAWTVYQGPHHKINLNTMPEAPLYKTQRGHFQVRHGEPGSQLCAFCTLENWVGKR